MDAARRIKDLSIALEALSRVNRGFATTDLATRIEELLNREIQKEEKENERPYPPARPASVNSILDDDNIPF